MDWFTREKIDVTVGKLNARFNDLERQKEDIEFYEDAVIDKFIETIKNEFNYAFPFDRKFFSSLCNKGSENHKANIETTIATLQMTLCKDIKAIDNVICGGYDMYYVNVEFHLGDKVYALDIPVRDNINRHNVVWENNGSKVISWDKGMFHLKIQTGESSWSTVWSGYDIKECDYFK